MVNFKNKYPMMIFAFPKKAISENLKEYCDSRSEHDFLYSLWPHQWYSSIPLMENNMFISDFAIKRVF
jgi:hypothetical protein